MRKDFERLLYSSMSERDDIFLITGDLGYGLWDRIRDDFPNRFINAGSSEVAMMGMAVGLAMEGMTPFVYSITPFALYRPFEVIRNYIDHEKIPVNIVGGGRDKDYGYLGFSHWAEDDRKIMRSFENISSFWPEGEEELSRVFKFVVNRQVPSYINLRK